MRLLVTGGAGFIGANFVRQTLEERPEREGDIRDLATEARDQELGR